MTNKDMFFGDLSEFEVNLDDLESEEVISLNDKESKVLADIVVSNRYLNMFPKLSKEAMEILAARRVNGENFPYEDYIDNKIKEMPQLNNVNYDFMSIIKKIRV